MYLCVLTYLSQLEQFLIFEFICENNVIVNKLIYFYRMLEYRKGKAYIFFACLQSPFYIAFNCLNKNQILDVFKAQYI